MFSNLTTITSRVCANNILLGCTRLSVRQHRRMCMDTEKKQEDRVAESLCVLSDGRISLLDYLYFLPPHKQNKAIDKFLFGGYILISQITACTDQVGIIRAIPWRSMFSCPRVGDNFIFIGMVFLRRFCQIQT